MRGDNYKERTTDGQETGEEQRKSVKETDRLRDRTRRIVQDI